MMSSKVCVFQGKSLKTRQIFRIKSEENINVLRSVEILRHLISVGHLFVVKKIKFQRKIFTEKEVYFWRHLH